MRLTAVALVLMGCGSSVHATGDDGPTTAGDDDDTVIGDDDDDTTAPPKPLATLSASSFSFGATTQTTIVAAFQAAPPDWTTTTEGPELEACEVYPVGTTTTGGTTTTTTWEPASAGEVTVTLGDQDVPLTEQDGVWMAMLQQWPAGQSLSFAATGDEVPGFDAPDLVVLPEAPLPAEMIRDATTGDLTVRWGGAAGDQVYVYLSGPDAGVFCLAEDDGEFTVPGADADLAGAGVQVSVMRWNMGEQDDPEILVSGWAYAAAAVMQ